MPLGNCSQQLISQWQVLFKYRSNTFETRAKQVLICIQSETSVWYIRLDSLYQELTWELTWFNTFPTNYATCKYFPSRLREFGNKIWQHKYNPESVRSKTHLHSHIMFCNVFYLQYILTQPQRTIQQLVESQKWLTENDSLDSFMSSHGGLSLFISFITAAHTAKVIKGHSFQSGQSFSVSHFVNSIVKLQNKGYLHKMTS